MKILMVVAAFAMSAGLVVPTVNQAEIDGASGQASKVANGGSEPVQRQA